MNETLPIMVLSEETTERVTFRFQNVYWAMGTGLTGIGILLIVAMQYFSVSLTGDSSSKLFVPGLLGVLLIYSGIASITATQWLTADGEQKIIKFYKKNLYGRIYWERQSHDFKCIRVWKYRSMAHWNIALICNDGLELYIGENVLGALSMEAAVHIAKKVSSKTGVKIESL